MSETKRYYWLKLEKNFFKRHDIQIIESMENGKDYVLFYLKLILESINHEGKLRFNDLVPYNDKMLATITNTNVDIVRSAIKIFEQLGLMEIWEDQTIFIEDTQKMLGFETEWAQKKREYRAQKSAELQLENKEKTSAGHSKDIVRQEKELDIELELEKELEIEKELSFITFWNEYPKKVGKAQAEKTFKKIVKDEPTLNAILLDLRKRKNYEQWTKDKGKYIPNPSTYLNQERWLDEYETGNSSSVLKQYQELFGND